VRERDRERERERKREREGERERQRERERESGCAASAVGHVEDARTHAPTDRGRQEISFLPSFHHIYYQRREVSGGIGPTCVPLLLQDDLSVCVFKCGANSSEKWKIL
jgi:hypothetical protein